MTPTTVIAASCSSYNIFCGVKPNFDWLGPEVRGYVVVALGGVLGLAIIAMAFFMIRAIIGLRHAKSVKNPQKAEQAIGVIVGTSLGLVALVLLPVIFGGLLIAGGLG